MRYRECHREAEVLEAVSAERCDGELRRHLATCERCRDLYDAAGALLHEGRAAVEEAPVRSSGLVWWRIQLRLRREAAERANRVMITVQAVVLCLALTLCFSAFGAAVLAGIHLDKLPALGPWSVPLVLGLVLSLLLVPLVIYFVRSQGRTRRPAAEGGVGDAGGGVAQTREWRDT